MGRMMLISERGPVPELGGFPWRCFDTCETPGDCMMDGCQKGYKNEEAPLLDGDDQRASVTGPTRATVG